MKKLLSLSLFAFLAVSSFASAGELDGKKFCRSINTGGMMGQPKGIREHCVSFKDNQATDNSPTFFGNPPRTFGYTVQDAVIMNADGSPSSYIIVGDDIMIAETMAVLKLQQ